MKENNKPYENGEMKYDITVSVIIPFYSNIGWLYEAVDSVFSQTFERFEVILINDGSDEDISDLLKKHADKIVYKYKVNGGPASARNLGIDIAQGKYIAFLDSDDIWCSTKLESQVKFMEESNAIWCHTNYIKFYEGNPSKLDKIDLANFRGNIFPQSLLSTHIATPCVMIRCDYLKNRKDLRFNESMRFGQDYYLWLILSSEIKLELIPKFLCKVRIRGNNAAIRAKAHLQVRAQIWQYLKNDPKKIFFREKWFFIIRSIYRICFLEYTIMNRLEKRRWNVNFIESMSKLIYILPYFFFKLVYYTVILSMENEQANL